MCRYVCPVERVTRREATTPHGWALLVASVNRGMLKWDAETVDLLYQCADCGLCQANCATDRPLPAALVAARAEAVRLGLAPSSVKELDEKFKRSGDAGRGLVTARPPAVDSQPSTVGLFVGAAETWPHAVEAAEKLLEAAGISPMAHLGMGRPSPYLAYTIGLWDTARSLAERISAEIEESGVSQVVTLSAEDAHTLKHIYPELGFKLPEHVLVTELVEVLALEVEKGRIKTSRRDMGVFTYHDSCHTPRLPDRVKPARRLIVALTGSGPKEMLWREKRAAPCGAVGGLLHTQPKLAAEMARARVAEARSTGAQVLLTDDPNCAGHLGRNSDGMQVLNLIELLAEAV